MTIRAPEFADNKQGPFLPASLPSHMRRRSRDGEFPSVSGCREVREAAAINLRPFHVLTARVFPSDGHVLIAMLVQSFTSTTDKTAAWSCTNTVTPVHRTSLKPSEGDLLIAITRSVTHTQFHGHCLRTDDRPWASCQ